MTVPRLHPNWDDDVESERCPACGTPGVRLRTYTVNVAELLDGLDDEYTPAEEWGCPSCDPALRP